MIKNEMMEKIIRKAWDDDDFRQQLLNDPKQALKLAFGVDIPDFVNITIHESKPCDLHFILPENPEKMINGELSDEELEMVAGGKSAQRQECFQENITDNGPVGGFFNAVLVAVGNTWAYQAMND